MKILQLVPEELPTHRPDVATLFGKSLPDNTIICDILGKTSAQTDKIIWPGRVWLAPASGSRLKSELGFLRLCLKTVVQAKQSEYACVQVRDMVVIGFLVMLICRIKGIPFIYWMSYLTSEARIERARSFGKKMGFLRSLAVLIKGYFEYGLLYRLVLPYSRHIFVQSDAMKRKVAASGIDPGKMTPVPMGVDLERICNPKIHAQRLPGWEKCRVIAYLGTLDALRSLEILVDTLFLVRRQYPEARLLLIGGGNKEEDTIGITRRTLELGIADAVHITGWMQSEAAWALLKGADLACSPIPRGEILDTGSPTKLLEYLALGIPCVANDSPDQRDVLMASNAGWLVTGTAEDYSKAIIEILDDIDAARSRAKPGLPYLQAHRSYDVLGQYVAKVYRKVLNSTD